MGFEMQQTPYGPLPRYLCEGRLGDLCIENGVQTGPFGSQLHQEDYVAVGTPIITVEHLGDNRIIHRDLPCVTDEDRARLSKYSLHTGDIVFSRVGSVDRRAIVQETEDGWLFSGRCLRVRPNIEHLNPQWLSYFFGLPAFKQYIRSIAVGATMPSINTKILSDVPIYFPPLECQRTASNFLTYLDNKIQLNYQINQTLEQMAQALFKSWFVDFEPVKAKITALEAGGTLEDATLAAMTAISGKDSVALMMFAREQPDKYAELKTTAKLFPTTLQYCELGEIPQGWGIEKLGSIIEFNPKRTLKKGAVAPYLDMKNVPTDGHSAQDVIDREFSSGSKFKNGDTLLARITPCLENGKTAYVDFLPSDESVGWGSTEFIVMRAHKELPSSISYFFARLDSFRAVAIQSMQGTSGRQRADASVLDNHPWVMPPKELLQKFGIFCDSILGSNKSRCLENKSLSQLRDTLLPKLLSGEITLPEAEAWAAQTEPQEA